MTLRESMERRNCLYTNSMLRLEASLAGFSFKSFALVKITYTENITWRGKNDKNVSYNFPRLVNMSSTLSSFVLYSLIKIWLKLLHYFHCLPDHHLLWVHFPSLLVDIFHPGGNLLLGGPGNPHSRVLPGGNAGFPPAGVILWSKPKLKLIFTAIIQSKTLESHYCLWS